jgi:tripartite-type tricarboxylate transporter receptor subunit TctC
MNLPSRGFLHGTAGAVAVLAAMQGARAQTYPSASVRWLIPMAPGDMPDILARLLGRFLSERLGQPLSWTTIRARPLLSAPRRRCAPQPMDTRW